MLNFQPSKVHHSIYIAIHDQVQYMVKESIPHWEAFSRSLDASDQTTRGLGRFRAFNQACAACEVDMDGRLPKADGDEKCPA